MLHDEIRRSGKGSSKSLSGGTIEVFPVIRRDMRVMTTAVPGFAAITCATCDGFKTKTGADIDGNFAISDFENEKKMCRN